MSNTLAFMSANGAMVAVVTLLLAAATGYLLYSVYFKGHAREAPYEPAPQQAKETHAAAELIIDEEKEVVRRGDGASNQRRQELEEEEDVMKA